MSVVVAVYVLYVRLMVVFPPTHICLFKRCRCPRMSSWYAWLRVVVNPAILTLVCVFMYCTPQPTHTHTHTHPPPHTRPQLFNCYYDMFTRCIRAVFANTNVLRWLFDMALAAHSIIWVISYMYICLYNRCRSHYCS